MRDRLAYGCVHAFIGRMKTGIAADFTRVEERLGTLLAHPEQRAALPHQLFGQPSSGLARTSTASFRVPTW